MPIPRLSVWRGRPSSITLADRARDAGQWELATRHYRKALDRNPHNPPIWVQYGHVLKEWGHVAEAVRAYQKAIELDPNIADAHLQHALKIQDRKERHPPLIAELSRMSRRWTPRCDLSALYCMLPHNLLSTMSEQCTGRAFASIRRPVEYSTKPSSMRMHYHFFTSNLNTRRRTGFLLTGARWTASPAVLFSR